jgi:hypothetical protein
MNRNRNWNQNLTLVVILAITILSFGIWMIFVILVWLFSLALGGHADLWSVTSGLSTAVAAAAVLAGGFVAYRELTELANSRHLEVADRLFNELNSKENIAARRWIFLNLPEDPETGLKEMTEEGRAAVKQVLNSLDRVAFLTQAKWIPDEMIMPWMNPMIVKSWEKLKPYVDYESRRRNEPDYYQNVRLLAESCVSWRKKNLQEAEITWVDNAL